MPRAFVLDHRVKDIRRVEVRLTPYDARLLADILKKLVRMCENSQPVLPNFTQGEVDLSEELWKSLGSIDQ